MRHPYVYGFAVLRILHDRRISDQTKMAVAERALEVIEYGADMGLPFGLYAVLHFLLQQEDLRTEDLRYGLVVSAGEQSPFRGLDRATGEDFFRRLLDQAEMPPAERTFWGHSLIARHQDQPGAADFVNLLLGHQVIAVEDRRELCQAWINFRQPRLSVAVPEEIGDPRADFVADHMGFWIAHVPSWPSRSMVRLGLVWLARLGADPLELAQVYIAYQDTFAEQIHAAVADIIAEHYDCMPENQVRSLIEKGIAISGSGPTRRRFYRLGTDLFGPHYLERATADTANSVRQWAVRQLQKQT
jgi:hypothetical protein